MLLCATIACSSPQPQALTPAPGLWRFVLQMNEVELPFHAAYAPSDAGAEFVIANAEERIEVDEIEQRGDSLIIKMPIFNSVFYGKLESPSQLSGVYQDYSRGKNYLLPFEAIQGDSSRFAWPEPEEVISLAGRWRMDFSPATDSAFPAVGIFEQEGEQLTGTILTETGDYRYLEGSISGTQVRLSAFDGSHAFLFHGNLQNDSLFGTFFSGKHWEENWVAVQDENATLRDPNALTYLNPGYEGISFAFPDTDSNMVSLSDPRFQDKAVIVQLLGTWCPNCMDESKYFAKLYKTYQPQGLEIVGLAYERQSEFQEATSNIKRLADRFEIKYPILIAGNNSKVEAAKSLPMLNHVLAFPTSIFIDKTGRVRKIHTGFNGPGTGDLYTRFVDETTQLVEKLVGE
ncbi:MAG: TlpA disulfide reductase family protein [Bacteroidota bacterium]